MWMFGMLLAAPALGKAEWECDVISYDVMLW